MSLGGSSSMQEELTWAKLQHHVLNKLEENASEAKEVKDEVKDLSDNVTRLEGKVDRQGEDIKQLLTLVRDGNGKAALLVRQELLEQRVITLEKEKDVRDTEVRDRTKSNRGSLIALACSITLLILNILWGLWKDTQVDLKMARERASFTQPQEKKNP